MEESIVFIDSEIGTADKKILDLGAVKEDGSQFHGPSVGEFSAFIAGAAFLCGHNIVHHDLRYLGPLLGTPLAAQAVDTLYLSPLLFPERPYHALLKDDKLQSDELNNPLNDAEKARRLFYDEVNAFSRLSAPRQELYYGLLNPFEEFQGFFACLGFRPQCPDLEEAVRREFAGQLCQHADLRGLIDRWPMELAYALALIGCGDCHSVTPPWLVKTRPKIEYVIRRLRGRPCREGCPYCREAFGLHRKLKEFFGFDQFRSYDGEPLQERAAQAAVEGKSLLAVFPTGGGKSVTFQLPALMAGQAEHGLTVVISPLQSLMKDQVDNLNEHGLVDAVTVNGLLSPVERAEALERVANGLATVFYISPEQLRSRTIETLLLARNVVRFVIDEAHCFSAWGQDFRVDYLYIGDFIRELQAKKGLTAPIPVSCFTATAKQKVISDIRDYFQDKLGVELELFTSSASRENLRYVVLHQETEGDKYNVLRSLIEQRDCPAIVYVSRTRRTRQLAEKLTSDGFPARPYNGKMDPADKVANQDAFIRGEVRIIVATSAFGMGVDKKDVGLVVHYDISDSLENYIQEAGRAGRDPSITAECYVLFHDGDLDKHFILLNQTKLSISEIQQVWKAMKDLTRHRAVICCSPLEIARQAGWDDSGSDMETRVKTAIAALENAGYVKRGRNMPRVYANSIRARNMEEAARRIDQSSLFSGERKGKAKRIIQSLISSRSVANAGNDDAESRVDYLADILGLEKRDVIDCVNLMRQEGLLADSMDMSAYIYKQDTQNRSMQTLNRFGKLEQFLLDQIGGQECAFALKELNEAAMDAGVPHTSVRSIRTVLYYWTIKGCIAKQENGASQYVRITPLMEQDQLLEKYRRRMELCRFILEYLYAQLPPGGGAQSDQALVQFSLYGLHQEYSKLLTGETALADMEDALLYLSKTGAMRLEGGFLVLYNGMEVKRLILDNKIRYKQEDYRALNEYYKQKIQQIHIVGEYANLMVRDYSAALQFVQDYFQMDFKKFIAKYFKGERAAEISRNMTPERYRQLFGDLSETQASIIQDAGSKYIVAAAGPGSGKTRVLVHKLASLLTLEDVKHEQLLMVTFSRAAATEFKKRLMELIGNAANFVEIKTFHSYCFDLLGKIGSLDKVEDVVKNAAALIESGGVEPNRIAKTVLVIDEAQDMDENEFRLIRALMRRNEEMRVIAVGDDDQNIYQFRGSDSKYMGALIQDFGAVQYEMTENYRSRRNIVALANAFVHSIRERMKGEDIRAVRQETGAVRIVRHTGGYLEQPVVEEILQTHRGETACVLTNTNEEALRVLGLLTKHQIRARLIQSMDGFRLYDLAEVRFFLKILDRPQGPTPVISDEAWEEAKARLQTVYSSSACLENCLNLIADFERVNSYGKYRSDLEEFIRGSRYEDFYSDDRGTMFVSTIHKSKGREFDSVYLLLDRFPVERDEDRRKLYVAMTRARDNLFIHCNTEIFDALQVPDVERVQDSRTCSAPEEITLQLTHRDVVLDFFKDKKEKILRLRSGGPLGIEPGYLTASLEGRSFRAAKFSRACAGRLEELRRRGYRPVSASVRFVVAWKGREEERETAVLLADLHLSAGQ
ncbi:RecQ family ATP-dependent DNA helicase [Pseudoflavonifractor sp. 60]|uniref:RecQ family ATP-dependent DNA helicase n=1 Tax=Pseudoflavonifractor sp. 60 TaxID=2304576 RepID=UPI001371AA5F|nr:RecQ family ATP-dependent DNA helicase [Pseudoflavonifractor sp. 60]NBI65653.1 RecQ family ATP-dependent DNA helicase [Pseudoflavonifractor sp. 60]